MAQQTRPDKQPVKKQPKRPCTQPAPYFAYPSGKAVPLGSNSSLFAGKTFHVRCDFPDLYLAQFIRDIEVRVSLPTMFSIYERLDESRLTGTWRVAQHVKCMGSRLYHQ